MEEQSDAPQTIPFSQSADGVRQAPWQWERVFTAVKTCPVCGKEFRPNIWRNADGLPKRCLSEQEWKIKKYCSSRCQCLGRRKPKADRPHRVLWKQEALTTGKKCQCCGMEMHPAFFNGKPVSRKIWERTHFCSISCARKVDNPMFRPGIAEKVSRSLKEIGHFPKQQGGNGRELTKPQKALAEALDAQTEYPVLTTQTQREMGAPHCYKLDVAIPSMKLAFQLDGNSHSAKKTREADRNTRRWLAESGWSVLHISNSKALVLCTICKSKDTLLTTLTESWFTTATS